MNLYPVTKEKVVVVDGKYLFPSRFGGATLSALSLLNSSVNMLGAANSTLILHATADREGEISSVLSRKIEAFTEEIVEVPARITDLFAAPADETKEETAKREAKIKYYFELA